MKEFFRNPHASILGVFAYMLAAKITTVAGFSWWQDMIVIGVAGAFSYIVTDD